MSKFRVNDWDEWQTYRKDRDPPPWIKVHRRIFLNRKWARLTDAQKGQLLSIWILAADDNGQVPNDSRFIRKACGLDEEPDLQVFVSLGFMVPDVTVTSQRRQRDAPEAEAEAEAENSMSLLLEPSPSRFDEIKDAYPPTVRRNWKLAEERYQKLVKKHGHDFLLAAVEGYAAIAGEPQYVKDPAAFFGPKDKPYLAEYSHVQPNGGPPSNGRLRSGRGG